MADPELDQSEQQIANQQTRSEQEHIDFPQPSGKRFHGKAVVPYGFDGAGIFPLMGSLIGGAWDYFSVAYPDSVTEIYTFKLGGSGGSTVNTLTIVYTDSIKANVTSLAKS